MGIIKRMRNFLRSKKVINTQLFAEPTSKPERSNSAPKAIVPPFGYGGEGPESAEEMRAL